MSVEFSVIPAHVGISFCGPTYNIPIKAVITPSVKCIKDPHALYVSYEYIFLYSTTHEALRVIDRYEKMGMREKALAYCEGFRKSLESKQLIQTKSDDKPILTDMGKKVMHFLNGQDEVLRRRTRFRTVTTPLAVVAHMKRHNFEQQEIVEVLKNDLLCQLSAALEILHLKDVKEKYSKYVKRALHALEKEVWELIVDTCLHESKIGSEVQWTSSEVEYLLQCFGAFNYRKDEMAKYILLARLECI